MRQNSITSHNATFVSALRAGLAAGLLLGAALLARAGSGVECIIANGLIGLGCAPIYMGALFLFARTFRSSCVDPAILSFQLLREHGY